MQIRHKPFHNWGYRVSPRNLPRVMLAQLKTSPHTSLSSNIKAIKLKSNKQYKSHTSYTHIYFSAFPDSTSLSNSHFSILKSTPKLMKYPWMESSLNSLSNGLLARIQSPNIGQAINQPLKCQFSDFQIISSSNIVSKLMPQNSKNSHILTKHSLIS